MSRPVRTCLVAVGLLVATPFAPAADPPSGLVVGVATAQLNLPVDSIKALAAPMRAFFARRAGISAVEVVPTADPFALAERLADGRCQLAVFHGYEFAWAQEKFPDLRPLVVTVYTTGRPRGCVVVRTDNPAARLADLRDQAVSVPVGTRGHCLLYLDRERAGLPETTANPRPPAGTPEEALDAVGSGTAPAALVDASAVAGYTALHPGAAKKLRVLCESEPFPANVVAYSPKLLPAAAAERLRESLVTAHTAPAGRPLVLLWGITRFDHAPPDYPAQLAASTKVYPAPASRSGDGR